MPKQHKISLLAAILININITMGSGLFINTVILSKLAGALGGLTYVIIGLLLFPLILAVTYLLRIYPTGGFYEFGQQGLGSSYAGFLSAWSYYVGKLASATLSIHVAISLLQTIIPTLQAISIFLLDGMVIITYMLLNMLNIRQGSSIQTGFIVLKMIPVFFVILTGIFLFQGTYLTSSHLIWHGLPASIPLALFAFYGFESACAISKSIENPERNASLAVLASFSLSVLLTTLFQSLFYTSLGTTLSSQNSFLGAFPALVGSFFIPGTFISSQLIGILHIAIASSALGAAYGIIFSNAWNLHMLAQKKHIFFSSIIAGFNKNNIPYVCVILEALTCFIYLFFTHGSQIPLQLIAVLGLTITYTISVAGLFMVKVREKSSIIIPVLASLVCFFLLSMNIRNFFLFNLNALINFALIILLGSLMYWFTPGSLNANANQIR